MSSPVLDAYADLVLAQDALRKAVDEHLHAVGDSELIRLLRAHHRGEARHDSVGLDLTHARSASRRTRRGAWRATNLTRWFPLGRRSLCRLAYQ